MKKYSLIKVVIFFLLLGFALGWVVPQRVNVRVDGTVTRYTEAFNYSLFSLVLIVGYSITLVLEFYLNEKLRKKGSEL